MGALEIVSLILMLVVGISLVYGVIAIHDIPYEIALKRGHPHADAIQAAGWVSLFTLHAIWPLLWIWAYYWHPERGYGTGREEASSTELAELRARIDGLEKALASRQGETQEQER